MKRILAATTLAALLAAPAAQAETNYMIGATWTLGGNSPEMGISARVMLRGTGNEYGVGGGVTYFPSSGDIGYDAIGAWMQGDILVGAGYDFSNYSPVFTLGYYQ